MGTETLVTRGRCEDFTWHVLECFLARTEPAREPPHPRHPVYAWVPRSEFRSGHQMGVRAMD